MATYYVWSGATGSATGADWTNAFLTLAAAEAVWAATDLVYLADDHAEVTAATLSLQMPSTAPGTRLVSVNRGTGLVSAGASIATSGTSGALGLSGYGYLEGISLLSTTSSTSTGTVSLATSTIPSSIVAKNCRFEIRNANAQANIFIGQTAQTTSDDNYVKLIDCVFKLGNVATSIVLRHGYFEFFNISLDAASASSTALFGSRGGLNSIVDITASDLSNISWGSLYSAALGAVGQIRVTQCKFPTGWAAYVDGGNAAGGTDLYVIDCATGDTNLDFGFYNALGSVVLDSATYYTGTPAGSKSWKITTTSWCSHTQPFVTPWIDFYIPLATVTPRIECLRNSGTASAYTNNEVYAEFVAKTTSGTPRATYYTDKGPTLTAASAQAAGAGTGSWTIGTSNSPYSFKVDTDASITLNEVGDIRGRVCVGTALAGVLFVDPVIRTA